MPFIIPAIIALVAGAMMKKKANDDAARRQRSFADAMESYQRMKSKESQVATEKVIDKQAPEQRQQEMQQEERKVGDSMAASVGAAQDASAVTGAAGKGSDDMTSTRERNAEGVSNRMKRAIQQMAAMRAGQGAQFEHNLRFGRAAGEIDANNAAMDSVGRGYGKDISQVRANPWLNMAGDVAMTVGGTMLGGVGGVAGAAASQAMPTTATGEGAMGDAGGTGIRPRPSSSVSTKLGYGFRNY